MMPDAAAAEVVRLQQALVANRNELKGAYQQARRQQKRVQCCGLGPAARRTTLAVYVLSNYNIALAVRVACRLSTYKRPEDAGFPTAAALEELFLESPPTLAGIRRASSAEGTRLFGRGRNFGLGA